LGLFSSSALHFSDYSLWVHHLVNRHLLAHAMASDFQSHGSVSQSAPGWIELVWLHFFSWSWRLRFQPCVPLIGTLYVTTAPLLMHEVLKPVALLLHDVLKSVAVLVLQRAHDHLPPLPPTRLQSAKEK
jgi:hypothetical protein